MRRCDTLIHAGIIVTQNEARETLERASMAVSGGIIRALGPTEEMRREWEARTVLDLPKSLLMPGLINAHTHAAMTFLRGYADDLPLLEWLEKKIFPIEAKLTPEIVRLGSLLGYAEMLACGVTGCVDMYMFESSALEAAELAGIRCLGGEAVFGFPSPACGDYTAALEETAALAERYAGSRRIGVAVNPHSVYTTDGKILAACRDLALTYNLPLHIHLAESAAETASCLKLYNTRPLEWCGRNGLFDCRLMAAHLVDINKEEIAVLAENGVFAIHNPASNMKLASGFAPAPEMLKAGVTVGLGSDGPASNNNLNMFQEMRLAALIHKASAGDPSALPAGAALDMATINGGKIMGRQDLGVLAPGMRADCAALDLTRPHMMPMHQPVSQLVYAASGHECQMTMVEGEIVYRDGRFARFDFEEYLKEFQALWSFVQKV